MRRLFLLPILLLILGFGWPAQDAPPLDICIQDFEDLNQNGHFDDGEPSFPGISVFVRRDDEVIGSLVTTPDLDCLRSLEPGDYVIEFAAGVPHQPVTSSTVFIALTSQPVTVDFGALPPTAPNPSGDGNQVCVLVYNDENTNSQREESEPLIGGVDVNLLVDDVIIRTLVTSANDYTCFDGLLSGSYRVLIPESARHRATTRNDFSPAFVDTGNRVEADFGAVRLNPFTNDALLPSYAPSEDKLDLDQDMRLLLAIFGTGLAVLFMIGMGAIVVGLIRR